MPSAEAMRLCRRGFLWHILIAVLLIRPSSSQVNGKFWWLQKDPNFGGSKEGSENLQGGNKETNPALLDDSPEVSYSAFYEDGDNDSGHSNEDTDEYDDSDSLPHRNSERDIPLLSVIAPSVTSQTVTQITAQLPLQPDAIASGSSSNSEAVESTVTDPNLIQPPQPSLSGESNCVCVEYYLCDSNNRIITNGEGGLIDVRLADLGQCPGVQVCCGLPEDDNQVTPTSGKTPIPVTRTPPVSSCGIRGGDLDPSWFRILTDDDNSTQFAEFPWMLALLRMEDMGDGNMEYNMFQCGASLIHPQVALTGAHCIGSRKENELKIRAGEWDTRDKSEQLPHQERFVSRIVKHPDFYSGALYNDIAILILDSPLEVAANILPVCLPEQDTIFDGSRCFATGWGIDAFGKNGKYQTTLKKVELPIVPSAECQDKLRLTRLGSYFHLHQNFLCAGGEDNRDTCKGDGGGPLVCRAPNSTTYVQVGIVSWGIGCGENGVPAVYTNVPRFRNWIDSSLKDLGLQ